jgi:hypothetical protein
MSKYVYLGADETKKYIKIGITSDIKRRQKEIQHMNPTFKMLYAWEPRQATAHEAERFFHSRFAEKRVYGEWFDLSIDELLLMTGGRGRYKFMSLLGRKS